MAAGHSMQVMETVLKPVALHCWSVVAPWKAKLSSLVKSAQGHAEHIPSLGTAQGQHDAEDRVAGKAKTGKGRRGNSGWG